MTERSEDRGFLYVASLQYAYYQAALMSIESLLDAYPEARITLATHADWVDARARASCEHIITDVPAHSRAKLAMLDRTPYGVTCYLDSDTIIEHEDVAHIFDELGDNDIVTPRIRSYAGKITGFPDGELTHHCGVLVYRSTSRVLQFMRHWWELYRESRGPWAFDPKLYPRELQPWDQFSFWYLLNRGAYTDLRVGYMRDDARWNFVEAYKEGENEDPIVVYHYRVVEGTKHAKDQSPQSFHSGGPARVLRLAHGSRPHGDPD